MQNTPNVPKPKIEIKVVPKPVWVLSLVLAVVFLGVYALQVAVQGEEMRMQREAYITSLADTYTTNVEDCRTASDKKMDGRSDEEKSKVFKETCLQSINSSRTASLLKSYGRDDLLQAE